MGCALAYQLARRDVDVLLLERETLGSQSTGKCAGGVRQQFSMEANVRLQRMSVKMFEGFEEETGYPADFRQIGYLFVLTLPQQVEDFRLNMEMWHRVGLTEARWVDPAEASRMVPVLNIDDVLGCTFCPTDGIASPADVTSGYAAAARRHGARLKEGSRSSASTSPLAGFRGYAHPKAISRLVWSSTAPGRGRRRSAAWLGSRSRFCPTAGTSQSPELFRRCRVRIR